jgi:hypothetical protein
MKRLILAFALVVCAASDGAADPCAADSLAAYIGLGSGGCTIGGNLFSDFGIEPTPDGAIAIDPSAIRVTPLSGSSGVGFEFGLDVAAEAGELLEVLIAYIVSGAPIPAANVALLGSTVGPDGANTAITDLCLGGDSAFFCTGTPATLLAFDIGDEADLSDLQSFSGTGLIGVVTDVAVDAGLAGSASLEGVTNLFRPAPEPSTLLMLAAGLAALAWRGRPSRPI